MKSVELKKKLKASRRGSKLCRKAKERQRKA